MQNNYTCLVNLRGEGIQNKHLITHPETADSDNVKKSFGGTSGGVVVNEAGAGVFETDVPS